MSHDELKQKALDKQGVKEEYENLEPEYNLLREMLAARHRAGMSQAEIAKRMGT